VEPDVRAQVANGGNKAAAELVGKLIAERAKAAGVEAGRVRPFRASSITAA
jgi:large subunit ribosomal protein L18